MKYHFSGQYVYKCDVLFSEEDNDEDLQFFKYDGTTLNTIDCWLTRS